ncbi:hypothetical protein GGR56DRAFT_669717 [Xylariaceae sp. FL0804]|nr:hypothetical protein GGR56DRAFT_669717 [Xylariaceae sp. FL0804]
MASDDFERHKAEIVQRFLFEKWSLPKIADHLEQEYNFSKKKHQYQHQLKRWGVKKNVPKDVWPYINHQLKKRKGRPSEVTLFGVRIPEAKLRKETTRHAKIPTAEDFQAGLPSSRMGNWFVC